jgi:hypothetical protein
MENNTNTNTQNQNQNTEPNTGAEQPKTYTQEEVDALLQSEADRRVSQALKKAEEKKAAAVKEAQRLAAMNEQEKYEYELQQRENAIAEKEKQLALAENKNEASKILAEKGISISLVDFIVAEDAETMKANIDLLDKCFKDSVKAEVEKRLKSATPKTNVQVNTDEITKDKFMKLSVREQQELFNTNPDLINTLLG